MPRGTACAEGQWKPRQRVRCVQPAASGGRGLPCPRPAALHTVGRRLFLCHICLSHILRWVCASLSPLHSCGSHLSLIRCWLASTGLGRHRGALSSRSERPSPQGLACDLRPAQLGTWAWRLSHTAHPSNPCASGGHALWPRAHDAEPLHGQECSLGSSSSLPQARAQLCACQGQPPPPAVPQGMRGRVCLCHRLRGIWAESGRAGICE